jgi:nitric oxide reductase subunit B
MALTWRHPMKGKETMTSTRRLWQGLALVFVLSFAALGWLGREIYLAAPPIANVVSEGCMLYTAA